MTGSNTLDSYLGSIWFENCLTEVFHGFTQPAHPPDKCQGMTMIRQLGNDFFLANPFHFIIHLSYNHSTLYKTASDSIIKIPYKKYWYNNNP
jgi:hypothetical protein